MAGEPVGRVGARAPDAFLRHQRVHFFVEPGRMRDRPDARFDCVPRALQRLHVAFDFHADLRRFADEQPNLVGGVTVRLAVHADLDHLRAEEHVLPYRFDDLVVGIRVEVLGIDDVVILRHLGRRRELSAHAADDDPRVDDRWPRNPALVDRLPQRGVGVQRVVPHVANDREARREHLDAVRRRLNRAQRRRFLDVRVVVDVALGLRLVGEREVVVRLDEAGQHGHLREIDDLRAGRDGYVRSDVADARPFDEDDLVRENAAGFSVEQPSCANRGDGRGRRRLRGN